MSIEEKVVKIVKQIGNDLPTDYSGINLFEFGVLDSLGVMQMIPEIDDTFEIELDVDDVVESNFDTIEHIVCMIKKYCK